IPTKSSSSRARCCSADELQRRSSPLEPLRCTATCMFSITLRRWKDALAQRDFSVILANSDDDPVREQRSLVMLRERQVDGLILATALRHDPAIRRLAAEGYPYVLVNRHTEPLGANAVVPDDYKGAVCAVEHLIALG